MDKIGSLQGSVLKGFQECTGSPASIEKVPDPGGSHEEVVSDESDEGRDGQSQSKLRITAPVLVREITGNPDGERQMNQVEPVGGIDKVANAGALSGGQLSED